MGSRLDSLRGSVVFALVHVPVDTVGKPSFFFSSLGDLDEGNLALRVGPTPSHG